MILGAGFHSTGLIIKSVLEHIAVDLLNKRTFSSEMGTVLIFATSTIVLVVFLRTIFHSAHEFSATGKILI
jgi:hypothetical protein